MIDLRTKYTNIKMAAEKAMKCLTRQEEKDIFKTFSVGKNYYIKENLKGNEEPIILDTIQISPTKILKVKASGIRVDQTGPNTLEIMVLAEDETGAKGTYRWDDPRLTDEIRYKIHNALRITMRGI